MYGFNCRTFRNIERNFEEAEKTSRITITANTNTTATIKSKARELKEKEEKKTHK